MDGPPVHVGYNDVGRLTKQVRPGNKITGYTVNAASQVRTETSPAGNATRYDYDLAGRPPKITNALGNSLSALGSRTCPQPPGSGARHCDCAMPGAWIPDARRWAVVRRRCLRFALHPDLVITTFVKARAR
ncbi:hypothetical protein ABZW49_41560 [Nonomuraea wenchangensis]